MFTKRYEPIKNTISSFETILEICTLEAPFYSPDGKLYQQVDGVAMGSPLGVLFANLYMGYIEENVFHNKPQLKPHMYVRYVDDTFIIADNENLLKNIIDEFKSNSVLTFTHEIETNNQLPFLDVLITKHENTFQTQVYIKDKNLGFCLNGKSETSDQYKNSVIIALVNRTFQHCSDWNLINNELNRIKKLLVNNNYSIKQIDHVINRLTNKYLENLNKSNNPADRNNNNENNQNNDSNNNNKNNNRSNIINNNNENTNINKNNNINNNDSSNNENINNNNNNGIDENKINKNSDN